MMVSNRNLLFQRVIFRCHVSLQGGYLQIVWIFNFHFFRSSTFGFRESTWKHWMISNFNLRCRCFYTRRGPAKGAIDVWRRKMARSLDMVVSMEWGWQQPAFGKCLNHLRFFTINVQMGTMIWPWNETLRIWDGAKISKIQDPRKLFLAGP